MKQTKQIESDKYLNASLKNMTDIIVIFLVHGLLSVKFRDWQYERNMKVLKPFLEQGKIQIMEKLRETQYMESMFSLLLVFILSIFSLYFFVYKYKKERGKNE